MLHKNALKTTKLLQKSKHKDIVLKVSEVNLFVCLNGHLASGKKWVSCHKGFCLMFGFGIDSNTPFQFNPGEITKIPTS